MEEIIDRIVSEIFDTLSESSINIFLCGKQISEQVSIRKELIEKYSENPRVNVVLPEWIFHDLFDKPDYDLLSLETMLAKDVDKIVLPIESFGTASELGAFSVIKEICDKLIVITESKYRSKPSFLRYGPFKMVKKSKGHLIYYSLENLDELYKEIIDKTIYVKYDKQKGFNIFNLSILIGICLLVFRPIKKSVLKKALGYKTAEVERIDAAIEILIQRGQISLKRIPSHDSILDLSEKGLQFFHTLVAKYNFERIFNQMRSKDLWTKRKNKSIFKGEIEKTKLLETTSIEIDKK